MSADALLEFPSPFGVHVLKLPRPYLLFVVNDQIVSVPFRGSRSEMGIKQLASEFQVMEFPSPFGVHVLKW